MTNARGGFVIGGHRWPQEAPFALLVGGSTRSAQNVDACVQVEELPEAAVGAKSAAIQHSNNVRRNANREFGLHKTSICHVSNGADIDAPNP